MQHRQVFLTNRVMQQGGRLLADVQEEFCDKLKELSSIKRNIILFIGLVLLIN